MCDETVCIDPYLLRFVPDRCVTTKMLEDIDNDETLGLGSMRGLLRGVIAINNARPIKHR